MTLDGLERPAAGEPAGTLVLLHGRGADEHDLYPLLDALDPSGACAGYARRPARAPPGGRHWYRLGGIPTPEPETFWPSFEALAELLDGLEAARARRLLAGRGDELRARRSARAIEKRPAALLPLSGFMPEVDGLELDLTGLGRLPGRDRARHARPRHPGRCSRAARDVLAEAGADVAYHEAPVGHTIDPEIVPALRDFVASRSPLTAAEYASGYTRRAMVRRASAP